MKKQILALTVAAVAMPSLVPPASAQNAAGQTAAPPYRGTDARYPCKKSSGKTGTIAGGVAGGLAGHLLGGGTLGTIAGAGGGALLGRHLDKKHDAAQNRKNGC